MDDFTRSAILFVQEHQRWGIPVVFLLAFCEESFAFISLLVPATGILFSVGGLVAAADIGFGLFGSQQPRVLLLVTGRIKQLWPFKNRVALLTRGLKFFKRWGMIAVFLGRFFGPPPRECASRGPHIRAEPGDMVRSQGERH
jgi:membrane protein DedA with SNARE-associated domain